MFISRWCIIWSECQCCVSMLSVNVVALVRKPHLFPTTRLLEEIRCVKILHCQGKILRNRYQRRIQNPVKHLRWSFLAKIINGFQPLTIFAKSSTLDTWQGSEYIFGCGFIICQWYIYSSIVRFFHSIFSKVQS